MDMHVAFDAEIKFLLVGIPPLWQHGPQQGDGNPAVTHTDGKNIDFSMPELPISPVQAKPVRWFRW